MTIFTQQFKICSLAARLATVTDGYVVWSLLWQLQTPRPLMLPTKRRIWHG